MDSPLLFPVKLKGDKIVVLDETALPFKEEYIEVDSLDKALWVLEKMKTRSLGQVFLFFYACLLFKDKTCIDDVVEKFKEKRPTFDFPFLGEILKNEIKKGVPLDIVINNFIVGFDMARKVRAKKLADILPNKANILTICNVNGELIYLYNELKKMGKPSLFYVSETRPYLQGTRLTFWELRKNEIPARLICDNQPAVLMKKGEINCIISGADRATKKGDIINKIGTYALARLAKYYRIPFYALSQYPQDRNIDEIVIEERESCETFMFLNDCLYRAIYPSFDVIKKEFITESVELILANKLTKNRN